VPKICYKPHRFRGDALRLIERIESICTSMQRQGYSMTVRQVYYALVSDDIIPNTEKSYDRIIGIINDARLSGDLDWDLIEDRTRNLNDVHHMDDPQDIIRSAARWYSIGKWANQPFYVEVWVEKEALAGVVGKAAMALDCPYFSCRGYVSQSEMWSAAMRLLDKARAGKTTIILHLGDHDPSGLDMTRDIRERLTSFLTPDQDGDLFDRDGDSVCLENMTEADEEAGSSLRERLESLMIKRIALNMDQIQQYKPPPNPAKVTDSRFADYQRQYGDESWELDALARDPRVVDKLIRDNIHPYIDKELWKETFAKEEIEAKKLKGVLDDAAAAYRRLS